MAFLLDTNVASELARPSPAPAVVAWVAARAPLTLHLSALTLGEIEAGIVRMPEGPRRQLANRTVRAGEEELFKSRAREKGSVRIIDVISARLDSKSDCYRAASSRAAGRASGPTAGSSWSATSTSTCSTSNAWVNLGGSIDPVYNAVAVAELAIEQGATTLLAPVSCRRQMVELSDDMAARIDVRYYADARDALLKALAD